MLGLMQTGDKYLWTQHSRMKMGYYRLTEARIKRIIRHPTRSEEGILEGAVAVMQPAYASAAAGKPAKNYSEIWVMYVLSDALSSPHSAPLTKETTFLGSRKKSDTRPHLWPRFKGKFVGKRVNTKKLKIITAWRYPGKSPKRDPVPPEIWQELREIL